MSVTEFAILKLRRRHHGPGFLDALVQCQELQDGWMQRNKPSSLEPDVSLSSFYIQIPNSEPASPPSLLITAPWDSCAAHGEWLQCQENQVCNGKLSEYVAPGYDSLVLFHMEAAGRQRQIRRPLLSRDTFNVCHMTVDSSQKDALQQTYQALEAELIDREAQPRTWAGWRIEQSGEADDLVVFWTDDVPERRLRALMSVSDQKVNYRFQYVV